MQMRRTSDILCCLVLAWAAFALPARGVPLEPPEPVAAALGRVPRSAEVVVVVDDLHAARRLSAVTSVFNALVDLRFVDNELKPKWAALAAKLGWDQEETLDRLLGSRVILMATNVQEHGRQAPWALLSDISLATEERLRERIPMAPRRAVEGMPIFAVEFGQLEIAMQRVEGAGGAASRVRLLLGPADRPEVLDLTAKALNKGIPQTLEGTPVVRELANHASPGVLLAVRLDPHPAPGQNPAAAHHDWDDFIVCTAKPSGREWECRLTIRDAQLRQQVKRIEPSSDAPYATMARGAMLAVLETRLAAPDAAPATLLDGVLARFTVPAGAEGILTGRQAVAVWPRAERPKGLANDATPALCLAFAVETTDVARMAPIGDKHVGGRIQEIERLLGGAGEPVPDFCGVACQAVRAVELDVPEAAPLRKIFDGPAHVAWSYPTCTGAPITPSGGWWQVCVTGDRQVGAEECNRGGGACAEASRQMGDALLQPPAGGTTDRWVSIGTVQPSRWAPVLRLLLDGLAGAAPRPEANAEPATPPAAVLLRLLERFESIEWRLAARDNDDIAGTLRLRMAGPLPTR